MESGKASWYDLFIKRKENRNNEFRTEFTMLAEDDAVGHVKKWAEELGITEVQVIGWDYPFLSQEQINVFHMHGYEAALIVEKDVAEKLAEQPEVFHQEAQNYIAITIKEPMREPFRLIPNAYKVLMTHMKLNGIKHKQDKKIIECFEKEYKKTARITWMFILR